MTKYALILTFITALSINVQAQDPISNPMTQDIPKAQKQEPDTQGKVTVVEDPRLEELTERFNETRQIKGYRIQICSSARKEESRKAKTRFVSLYPNMKTYELYQQPYYVIKIGDFKTKLEATKFHNELRAEFPQSFLFPDVIEPELKE